MSTKKIGWDDESISGSNYSERPDVYKAKQGFVDVVRILTFPVSLIEMNIKGKSSGFSTPCLADHDDVLEGFLDGHDTDAKKRATDKCPALARGYKPQRRFVSLLWHQTRSKNGRTKKVNQAIPFKFTGEKYEQLRTIASSLPPRANGKRTPMHGIEIQITCSDGKFQKMNFSYSPTSSQKWKDIKEEVEELFTDGVFSATGECELVQAICETDQFQQLEESLDRIEGKGNFENEEGDDSGEWEEEDFNDDEDDAPKKKKKRTAKKPAKKTAKKKRKPVVDDDEDLADELDDALNDEELDELDYEDDDDM